MENTRETVRAVLQRVNPRIHADSEDLIRDGELDSLRMVMLVTELGAEFDVVIPVREIIPDNFRSLESIAAMMERLTDF